MMMWFVAPTLLGWRDGGGCCSRSCIATPFARRIASIFQPINSSRSAGRSRCSCRWKLDTKRNQVHCENMKNITVSLDDETYRNARMKAAELDTSVSALVKRYLTDLGAGQTEFQRL